MKFQPGVKSSSSPYNQHFFQPGVKSWYYAHANVLFIFKKIKMVTSQARLRRTDDKRLQEFKCSMEFRNCKSNIDKVRLYESLRKSLNKKSI